MSVRLDRGEEVAERRQQLVRRLLGRVMPAAGSDQALHVAGAELHGVDITGLTGVTAARRLALLALGAIDREPGA